MLLLLFVVVVVARVTSVSGYIHNYQYNVVVVYLSI